jgi:hypothetical protein
VIAGANGMTSARGRTVMTAPHEAPQDHEHLTELGNSRRLVRRRARAGVEARRVREDRGARCRTAMNSSLYEILGRLARVRPAARGWTAACPGPLHRHGDRRPSLSISRGSDGRALIHCFAGCEYTAILQALGLGPEFAALGGRPRQLPGTFRSELQTARRDALARAIAEDRRHAAWAPWQIANAFIRRCATAVDSARAVAGALGPDDARTWGLLELAARVERDALTVEAELDAILEDGPLHLDRDDRVEPILARTAGRRP